MLEGGERGGLYATLTAFLLRAKPSVLLSTCTHSDMQKWTQSREREQSRKQGLALQSGLLSPGRSQRWGREGGGRSERGWKGNREVEELAKGHEFRLPHPGKGQ